MLKEEPLTILVSVLVSLFDVIVNKFAYTELVQENIKELLVWNSYAYKVRKFNV